MHKCPNILLQPRFVCLPVSKYSTMFMTHSVCLSGFGEMPCQSKTSENSAVPKASELLKREALGTNARYGGERGRRPDARED